MEMEKLQDLDGYPDKVDLNAVIEGDYTKEEIRDWAIDLLAVEAEVWLDYEDEVTANFAMAIIAACRPLMETMALSNGIEADQKILEIMIASHLAMTRCLTEVKKRAIDLGLREP